MRYDITLRLAYEYQHSASSGRHLLCLAPTVIDGVQRLVASHIEVMPKPVEEVLRRDFFGNWVLMIAYRDPHERIDITLQARVHRFAEGPALNLCPTLDQLAAELAQCRDVSPRSPLHFLGVSRRVTADPEMAAFARSVVTPGMSVIEAVRATSLAVHEAMAFDADATEVGTTASEAFAHRRGVCQDYSHILIACLRSLGIPAGYVSGYLRTVPPPGAKRLQGADAMHAWVRAWCGADAGWIEVDPTNAVAVSTDHILVAVGRDYADVAPIRGVSRLSGGQIGRHTVDVIPE